MGSQSRDSLLKLIGSQVRECRKTVGITQAELAEKTGLSLDMVGRLERGITAPSLDTLLTLSEVLKVPLSNLVSIGTAESVLLRYRNAEMDKIISVLSEVESGQLAWVRKVIEAVLKK